MNGGGLSNDFLSRVWSRLGRCIGSDGALNGALSTGILFFFS